MKFEAVLIIVLLAMPCVCEPQGELFIAVYAAGNTLESSYGLISDDISSMISGINSSFNSSLELVVAYGGADKTGWKGITVASSEDLKEDLSDGVLGNGENYTVRNSSADMGDGRVLGDYLTFIRESYNYNRIFLILIGHGEAYTGLLPDENYNDDSLTISELVSALNTGGLNPDLIVFDSCLMSGIEVASSLSGYADYMIAGEESEPAEGLGYEPWIRYLAKYPLADHKDHATVLMEDFMKNPHQGKTLSLLDLSKTVEVTRNLEILSRDLEKTPDNPDLIKSVYTAIMSTQQFGRNADGTLEEATLDLYDLMLKLSDELPYFSDVCNNVIEAIDELVVLEVHDETVPDAHGISILSPVLINSDFYNYYREEAMTTPAWNRFIDRYLKT